MDKEIGSALIRVLPFLLVIIIFFFLVKRKKINPIDLCLNQPNSKTDFFFWTIGFLIFVLISEFSLYKFGILEVDKWHSSLVPSVIKIVGAVVLAPIAEEFIFRGLILSKLSTRIKSIHLAILVQACLFVLLHNFTYQNTVTSNIGIAQTFIDASLYAYARHYTKSIYTPITMHMTGNFIATLERFVF